MNDALAPAFSDILSADVATVAHHQKLLSYTVTKNDKSTVTFPYSMAPDSTGGKGEENLDLVVSGMPYVFKVSRARVSDVLNVQRAGLIKPSSSRRLMQLRLQRREQINGREPPLLVP